MTEGSATARPVPAVDAAYAHAWAVLKLRFWPLMGLTAVVLALYGPVYLLALVSSLLQDRHPLLGLLGTLAGQAWSILAGIPAQYGLLRAFARAARGLHPGLDDLISPFLSPRAYLSALANAALLFLVTLALVSPALVVAFLAGCGGALAGAQAGDRAATALLAAAGLGAFVVFCACLVPAAWVQCRLGLSQMLVADAGLGPAEAIARSWALTRGHAGTIFLVLLLAVPIVIAGFLAACVGFVPAMALVYLALASLYVALGGPDAAAGSPSGA